MHPDPLAPGDGGTPNAARMFDYYLGGGSNFAADRALASEAIALRPMLPRMIRSTRAFMHRAVQWCVEEDVCRFLDLGSGIPTLGHVHEVVRRACDDGSVVYLDREPVTVAHARALLAGEPDTSIVEADLRDVEAVLSSPEVDALLAPGRPVALVANAVLHFLPDADDPRGVLDRYLAALPPGSTLVLAHATSEGDVIGADTSSDLYRTTATPLTLRSRDEIAALCGGVDVVEPGLVFTPYWRPSGPVPPPFDHHPEQAGFYAAVGRVR